MNTWTLQNPGWLWLLAALVLFAIIRHRRGVTVFVIPAANSWNPAERGHRRSWSAITAYLGLALLILALARPQQLEQDRQNKRHGYDIILAIDLSTSMYAEDFQFQGRTMNRLQAVKPVLEAFINQRPNDRIGIVAFAARAYTFAPLTFDHDWLRKQTARLSIGLIEDGTAIGDAIGVAMSRLDQGRKHDDAQREGVFVVVLTDGASNRGALDPRQAARLAAAESIAVYTIGAGAEGMVPVPVFDYAGNRTGTEMRTSEIDSLLLRDVAETTGGMFFRADDADAVAAAFAAIDQANRIEFDAPPLRVSRELCDWFLAPAILLLLGSVLASGVRWAEEAFA